MTTTTASRQPAYTIYLVPHTHYDVVWAFNKEDYLFINASIIKKAIRLIREKGFRFLIEQTYFLDIIAHRDPQLYAEIEEAVRQGAVEMADAQYIMADPMIPGGEVLVREILLGKRTCKQRFGVDVPVAWAADGFGLNAQLPQIYKKSGYKWLAFRRGLPEHIGSRVSEFSWEGLDGTRIPAHWMPLGYRAGLRLEEWETAFAKLSSLATTPHVLMPCGSGGAIPQEDIPDKVAEWNERHPEAEMLLATPRDFFEGFDKAHGDLITYQGELYSDDLESVFPDVASSRIRLKLAIRDSEHALLIAEKLAALAHLEGRPYPESLMNKLWKKKLFLANHDVVPSCGVDEIYREAWEYIEDIGKATLSVISESLGHLLASDRAGNDIAVFNPNGWEVTDWVEAEVELGEGWSTAPGVEADGKEIRSEPVAVQRWDDGSVCRARLGFLATVPPLGCTVHRVVKEPKRFKRLAKEKDNAIITKHFCVAVDPGAGILEVKSRDGGLLLKGNEIILDEEIGDLYFHKSLLGRNIASEGGDGLHFGVFRPEAFSIARGPLRSVITFQDSYYCLRWPYYLIDRYDPVLYRHKTVEIRKKVIVFDDIPRIDCETHLNLLQSHVRIRLGFDTCMVAPSYYRQTQFGVMELSQEKTLTGSHKTPSLSWLAAEENARGLAFLTQGIPINEIKGGRIYCTLLRSVSVLSADGVSGPLIPTPDAQELGKHVYRYSIQPYAGGWREARIHLRGFEQSQPLTAISLGKSTRANVYSALSLQPDNLIVSAVKKSEDDDALILRFFESKGQRCEAVLALPPQIERVALTDLLEQEQQLLKLEGRKVRMSVGPFEIVTLKLGAKGVARRRKKGGM